MFCKTCGKELEDGAKFCDECGAPVAGESHKQKTHNVNYASTEPKRKKKHPLLVSVLLFFGIFMIVGALAGEGPEKVGTVDQPSPVVTEAAPSSFSVGDVVELNGVLVTLVNVTESSGANYFSPKDGNVFVICEFTIENNSSSDITVSSLMCFEAYFDDFSTTMDLSAIASTGKTQLDGAVASGKKMNGIIAYQAPADWTNFEIRFTPDFWSGRDIIFSYDK